MLDENLNKIANEDYLMSRLDELNREYQSVCNERKILKDNLKLGCKIINMLIVNLDYLLQGHSITWQKFLGEDNAESINEIIKKYGER